MNFDSVRKIIERKPLLFLLLSLGYLLLIGFFKWNIHPSLGTVLYFVGGLIGVYFLDVAEVFFRLSPSPFRSIVFLTGFVIVSLFIVSSSGSLLSSGLVLSMYLTLILWQIGEWEIHKNLQDWYRMISGNVSLRAQQIVLVVFIILFFVESGLFLRW